jgi:protein gp37
VSSATWNPIRARNLKTGQFGWYCVHMTTGCEFCYAEALNVQGGTMLPFKPGHRKDVEIFLDEKMLANPLSWRQPRMIFVASMSDIFADFVEDAWLDRIFAVMASCQRHIFQLLTKRPQRMLEYCSMRQPLPNVWLGVSCERQPEANQRIPLLLQMPAAVRFISAEPLLGPLDLSAWPERVWLRTIGHDGSATRPGLDWVLIGGESGPNARPFHVEWADDIVSQCKEAGVACFVKQLGSCSMASGYPLHLRDKKGGEMKEWPETLQVREYPKEVESIAPAQMSLL